MYHGICMAHGTTCKIIETIIVFFIPGETCATEINSIFIKDPGESAYSALRFLAASTTRGESAVLHKVVLPVVADRTKAGKATNVIVKGGFEDAGVDPYIKIIQPVADRKLLGIFNDYFEARSSLKTKTIISSLKNVFGETVLDQTKIANLLNYRFSKLGDYLGGIRTFSEERIDGATEHKSKFKFYPIRIFECTTIVKQLNSNKPLGPSNIPAWALNYS